MCVCARALNKCLCVQGVRFFSALLETQSNNWLHLVNLIIRSTGGLLLLQVVCKSRLTETEVAAVNSSARNDC